MNMLENDRKIKCTEVFLLQQMHAHHRAATHDSQTAQSTEVLVEQPGLANWVSQAQVRSPYTVNASTRILMQILDRTKSETFLF